MSLASWRDKSGVMVSVTLISKAFEHVAKNNFLIVERFLGNYTFCLISPWWLSLCHRNLVTLGKRCNVPIFGFLGPLMLQIGMPIRVAS
jgi:hypothetical protein